LIFAIAERLFNQCAFATDAEGEHAETTEHHRPRGGFGHNQRAIVNELETAKASSPIDGQGIAFQDRA
jgi:hypothetical protein